MQENENKPLEETSKENVEQPQQAENLVVENLEVHDVQEVKEKVGEESKTVQIMEVNKNYLPSPTVLQNDGFSQVRQANQALEEIKALAAVICKSKLSPLKTVEDVTLAIITGQQYGFNFMNSVANIFPINGKPTLSVHLHRALILNAGIFFKKDYDFEPMFIYIQTDKDGKVLKNGENQPYILGTFTKDNAPAYSVTNNKAVDRITQYTFKRQLKQPDGTFEKLEVVSRFKMSNATHLMEKDNWINYPERMLDARAFGIGSKEIGADILFGIYTISELADTYNIPYVIDENLQETILLQK